MITAVLLGLGLAFELKEPGIMLRPPREPGIAARLATASSRASWSPALILLDLRLRALRVGRGPGARRRVARTAAVNVFMSVQLFYLFACRSLRRSLFRFSPFGNRIIVLGVAVVVVLQLLFTYAPFMNVAFDTAPLTLNEWLVIVGFGAGAMVVHGPPRHPAAAPAHRLSAA